MTITEIMNLLVEKKIISSQVKNLMIESNNIENIITDYENDLTEFTINMLELIGLTYEIGDNVEIDGKVIYYIK